MLRRGGDCRIVQEAQYCTVPATMLALTLECSVLLDGLVLYHLGAVLAVHHVLCEVQVLPLQAPGGSMSFGSNCGLARGGQEKGGV